MAAPSDTDTTTARESRVDLPSRREPVEVAGDAWDGWLRSKVEDLDDGILVIEPPFAPSERGLRMLLPPPGTTATLHWSARAGLAEVRAEVVECPVRPVAVWRLNLTTTPVIAQRRAHHRVPVAIACTLVTTGAMWHAETLDVSEGGIRCIAKGRIAPTPGDVLDAVIDAAGTSIRTNARVLRVARTELGDVDVAMQFHPLRAIDMQRLTEYLEAQRNRGGSAGS